MALIMLVYESRDIYEEHDFLRMQIHSILNSWIECHRTYYEKISVERKEKKEAINV